MKRTVFGGLALAVAAVLTVYVGDALNLGLPNPLLGASVGGVLALVPGGHKLGRLAGFLVGGALAFIGYGFNAQFMPSASIGVAVTAVLTIGLATAGCRTVLRTDAAVVGAAGYRGLHGRLRLHLQRQAVRLPELVGGDAGRDAGRVRHRLPDRGGDRPGLPGGARTRLQPAAHEELETVGSEI